MHLLSTTAIHPISFNIKEISSSREESFQLMLTTCKVNTFPQKEALISANF
jgi:hypothetical protein